MCTAEGKKLLQNIYFAISTLFTAYVATLDNRLGLSSGDIEMKTHKM